MFKCFREKGTELYQPGLAALLATGNQAPGGKRKTAPVSGVNNQPTKNPKLDDGINGPKPKRPPAKAAASHDDILAQVKALAEGSAGAHDDEDEPQ